jgi:beta-lactam-binding protein with PASTA domain
VTRHAGRSIAAAALCLVIGWGGAATAQNQPKVPGIAWTKPRPIAVPPRKPWPPIRPPVKIALTQTPLFIGQNREEAARLALASGLRPGFYGDSDAQALVVIQSLPERWPAPRGTEIDLTLRDPPQPVTVETVSNYFGLDRRDAFDAVRGADLQPRFTGANTDDATVADQRPQPKTEVPAGSPVVLIMAAAQTSGVSTNGNGSNANGAGPPPNNQTSTTDGSQTNNPNSTRGGSQTSTAGVPNGGVTDGGVNKPPPTSPDAIDNFIGLTRQQASDLARKNALEPQLIGASGDGGRVVDQSPSPGDRIARPAQISLTLAAAQAPPPPPKSNIGLIAAAFAVGLGVASLATWALRSRPDAHKPQPTPGVRVQYQADPGVQSVRYRLASGDDTRSAQLPPRPPPAPADV